MRAAGCFVIFYIALFTASSFSLQPVRFGPEFTFMPDPSLNTGNLFDQLNKHLMDEQPEGAKFSRDSGYEQRWRWVSPNGWWMAAYTDSGGYEVNVKPMTIAEYKKYAADLQDAIFVSAANVGHFPALWQGGGHLNIDIEIFRRNPLLLRNFLVDFVSHNELYMGILNYDPMNAAPFRWSKSFDNGFHQFLLQLDIDFPHLNDETVLDSLAESFCDYFISEGALALSLCKSRQSRIELRAVRPQASIDVFIRQIELIEARLRYLETIKTPIAYRPQVPVDPTAYNVITKYNLKPPVNPQEALRAFYVYVTEAGQLWRNHRDYLWPQWISGGELEKFEMSDWFQSREGTCPKLLLPN
jgi:hypothetical protein